MDYSRVLALILSGTKQANGSAATDHFCGTGFAFIDDWVATCKHVVEVGETERLMVSLLNWGPLYVEEVRCHPQADFALCKVPGLEAEPLSFSKRELRVGTSAIVWSHYLHRPDSIGSRFYRGYVSGINPNDALPSGKRVMELSFPCFQGTSGSPVIAEPSQYLVDGKPIVGAEVLGMVFGNKETSIEVYSYEEIVDEVTHVERTCRITEYGVFHAISDCRQWAEDLGVSA